MRAATSGLGQERTSAAVDFMSAIPPITDMVAGLIILPVVIELGGVENVSGVNHCYEY